MIDYADPKRVPPESPPARAARRIATGIWQALVAVLLPGAVVVAVTFALAGPIAGLFGLLATLLLFVTARSLQLVRQRHAMIVLAHIETVIRSGLPLVQTLRTWRMTESRPVSLLLGRVADALEDGAGVSDALLAARADLPWRVLDRLAAAERAGRLVPAISEVLAAERRRRMRDPTHWPFVKTYALALMIFVPGIITVISIFVMPKYQQILRDFRLPPPPMMRWVIALAQGIAPIIAAVGIILFMIAGQIAVAQLGRPSLRWRQLRHGFVRTMIDRARWVLPIVGAMDRDRGMADVMATIAEALDAQRPLVLAVAEAHQPHLNAVLAERVNEWGQWIAAGLSPGAAAAKAGLPRYVSGMLGTTRPTPNIAAVCHFLERYYRSRFSRAEALIRESGVPIVALLGGAAVVLVALSIFQPIVMLLDRVAVFKVRP